MYQNYAKLLLLQIKVRISFESSFRIENFAEYPVRISHFFHSQPHSEKRQIKR